MPNSANPLPPPNPAQMQALVAHAGLLLNPGQMADLVLAWRQVASLLAEIPRERPLADDQAYVFRLPPPDPNAPPTAIVNRPRPAASKPPRPKSRRTAPQQVRKSR